MSPYDWSLLSKVSEWISVVFYVRGSGSPGYMYSFYVSNSYGVRPVISFNRSKFIVEAIVE